MKEDILSNPCWERLKRVIRYSGLSTNAFARAIGLKRGENLYQIKKVTTASVANWPSAYTNTILCFRWNGFFWGIKHNPRWRGVRNRLWASPFNLRLWPRFRSIGL